MFKLTPINVNSKMSLAQFFNYREHLLFFLINNKILQINSKHCTHRLKHNENELLHNMLSCSDISIAELDNINSVTPPIVNNIIKSNKAKNNGVSKRIYASPKCS
jgi:hypothetical protein